MKLLVRQHLQGMKERGGLDVLLPQLLSELGYEIIHHPRIGGRQAGVDVAAVGPDPDAGAERSLLLFVIKSGDVGRQDWNGSLQAVRPSLNEVIDDYIPNRVSQQHRNLPISVCVCMGGRDSGRNSLHLEGVPGEKFDCHATILGVDGDRLANLILSGVLNKELLDPAHRSHFQKAIALVSEPEEAYYNFKALLDSLTDDLDPGQAGTTRLRQMLICLWILVGNGFDAENLDAPYRTCELALLHAWDAYRKCPERPKTRRAERLEIFNHVLTLYLSVSDKLLVEKIGIHAARHNALSAAVRSRSALDVNLSLFDALGRLALLGLWHHAIACISDGEAQLNHLAKRDQLLNISIETINSNATLLTPKRDDHHVEIGILMLLAEACERVQNIDGYFREVASRMGYRYLRRSNWPTCFQDDRQLARHPVDQSDEYFPKIDSWERLGSFHSGRSRTPGRQGETHGT